MKAFYAFALLLLLASCGSDETNLFALMGRETTTESAQTRDENTGADSASTTIGIVMEDTDFEEQVMDVCLGD